MKSMFLMAALSLVMVSCASQNASVVGSWVEPIEGTVDAVRGVTLSADGTASVINLATDYNAWKQEGSNLILTGDLAADTFTIVSATPEALTLSKGELVIAYTRLADSLVSAAIIPVEVVCDTMAVDSTDSLGTAETVVAE
ncbi:MAG: lipocalin family protein [Rikenellaceae bacterium]